VPSEDLSSQTLIPGEEPGAVQPADAILHSLLLKQHLQRRKGVETTFGPADPSQG